MIEFLLIILGLIGLWLGTEFVIAGAIRIAEYFDLSQIFIGIAIIAIGTDLPEIVISINASIQSMTQGVDTSGLIIGNAIGSSMSQISVVLGFAGLLGYLTMTRRHLYEDGIMLAGSVLLVFLLALDGLISRVDGIVFIVVYLIYYLSLFNRERVGKKVKKQIEVGISRYFLLLIAGIVIVIFTAHLVVENALSFAEKLGISQSIVGTIIVGLGTSLPELAISLNAIRKKAKSLSVGNLIGSNIFDLLIPIGIGGSMNTLQVEKGFIRFDLVFLFVISVLVLVFFSKKKGLQKKEAISLILLYIIYAVFKISGL